MEIKICDLCNEVKSKDEFASEISFKCFACMWKDRVRSKVFCCPVCNTNLTFKMEVAIKKIERLEDSPTYQTDQAKIDSEALHSDNQKKIIYNTQVEAIMSSGLARVFQDAVSLAMPDSIPKNLTNFLITFLKEAKLYTPSSIQMTEIRKRLPGNNHLVVRYLNILAIIVDGYLKMFIPEELLIGKKVKIGNTSTRVIADNDGMGNWIKTKYGYVMGKGLMYQEFKDKKLGEFDNLK